MTIALGIVGAGNIAKVHAAAAKRAGLTVAGICDVDFALAKALAADYPGAIATNSLSELLEHSEIPAMVVAVPNDRHMQVAVEILGSGRDILLEKPMAMSIAQCDEIIRARDESGRILQLGFVCRYAPAALEAKRLVESGELGSIYHAKAFIYRQRGIPGLGRWFTEKSRSGGGVLIDLGVHLIDLMLYLTGSPRPERVSATCTSKFGAPIEDYVYEEMWAGPPEPKGVFDVDDGVSGHIRCEGGLLCELNVTWAANLPQGVMPEGLILLGDKGGCYLNLWENRLTITRVVDGKVQDTTKELPLGSEADAWDRAWFNEHEYFAKVVSERSDPHAGGDQGRLIQQIIEAMYRSSDSGREIDLMNP